MSHIETARHIMASVAENQPALSETGRLLVVGLGKGQAAADLAPTCRPIPYVALADLDAAGLRHTAPDLILCALFAADLAAGDAFALVEQLESLHYRGRILVICPALPRPEMIEAELQALGPGPMLTLIARD